MGVYQMQWDTRLSDAMGVYIQVQRKWYLDKHKTMLVAKGFTQTNGIDYSVIFSPAANLDTVRVLLSITYNKDWPLYQLDVKNAFLNGDLKEEVYVTAPKI